MGLALEASEVFVDDNDTSAVNLLELLGEGGELSNIGNVVVNNVLNMDMVVDANDNPAIDDIVWLTVLFLHYPLKLSI